MLSRICYLQLMTLPANNTKRIILIVTQDGRRVVDVQGTIAKMLSAKP
jgi:hypothetical protein